MSLSTADSIHPSTAAASTPTSFSSPALSNATNGSGSPSLGLAFSSTPTSTIASSSTETSSTSNTPGPPGISKSSSLLFGFLVTFLALFVTFMACGFGGRRAMNIRRRRIAGIYDELPMSPSRMVKPQLWDVWIEDSGKERWPSMLPLSASIKRAAKEKPESLPQPRSAPVEPQVPQEYFPTFIAVGRGIARITATPTYSPAIRRGTSLSPHRTPSPSPLASTNAWSSSPFTVPEAPSWLSFLSRDKGQTKDADRIQDEEIEGLQVSVLIAMPTPRRSKEAEADIHEEHVGGDLGEFALGIATTPWSSPPEDLY